MDGAHNRMGRTQGRDSRALTTVSRPIRPGDPLPRLSHRHFARDRSVRGQQPCHRRILELVSLVFLKAEFLQQEDRRH